MHSYRRKIEIDMVSVTYLAASLLILVHPLEISGYAISRDLKLTPSSSPSLVASSENQQTGFDTKTIEKPVQAAHHVPLDTSSNRGTVSVVKREVNPSDGGGNNGLTYDPSMMIMSKRSAAALNKLMMALRSFEEPTSGSYENEQDGSNKENGRYTKGGSRSSGFNYDPFPTNALQRRGQKDRKIYLRCYFNAVSCF